MRRSAAARWWGWASAMAYGMQVALWPLQMDHTESTRSLKVLGAECVQLISSTVLISQPEIIA